MGSHMLKLVLMCFDFMKIAKLQIHFFYYYYLPCHYFVAITLITSITTAAEDKFATSFLI